LLTLNQKLSEAEQQGDIQTLDQLVADDYLGVEATGGLLTKQIVLNRFSAPELVIHSHQTSEVEVRMFENVGILIGRVTMKGLYSGEPFSGEFRYTDVYLNRNGQWQVVGSQMTPLIV
jgi:hypothetical protein